VVCPATVTLLEKGSRGTAAAPARAALAVRGVSGDEGGGVNPRLRSDGGVASGIGGSAWSSGCCAATPAHRSDVCAPRGSAYLRHSHMATHSLDISICISYTELFIWVDDRRRHGSPQDAPSSSDSLGSGQRCICG
jgi:hypothetical protein